MSWLRSALWAPSIIEKDKKFYLFFSGNNVQNDEIDGIGVAVAETPAGPSKDLLGKPLIAGIHHGAQPNDQFVFLDQNGQYYMIYGVWSHCNIAKLKPDFTGFTPFEDGTTFKQITPEGHVEGPLMFRREGKYYFMWSEGNWTGPDHSVIRDPKADLWYAVYHRRPLTETAGNHRMTCIDRMEFDAEGLIKPIKLTHQGEAGRPLDKSTNGGKAGEKR